MKRAAVVFDFDKTLTNKDTLFGFYRTVAGGRRLFFLKRTVLIAVGVLYKIGLIKNRTLKSIGIHLFLKGVSRDELEIAARSYADQIQLNDIYTDHYQKTDREKWILSASPDIYLKYLFPGDRVAGTTFKYTGNKVTGLATNMFGEEKKRFLGRQGISYIQRLYTDSIADKSLMGISEEVYVVHQGRIVQSK